MNHNIKININFHRFFLIVSLHFFLFSSAFSINSNVSNKGTTFRPGHNLQFFLSLEHSRWTMSQSEKADTPSHTLQPVDDTEYATNLFIRYTNHINILSFFGIFIGSTVGILPNKTYSEEGILYLGTGYLFPTILLGLVFDFSENLRSQLGGEYGAIYYPSSSVKEGDSNSNLKTIPISFVPDMLNAYFNFEYFYTKNLAIMNQIGFRYTTSYCLNQCLDKSYVNNLRIRNTSYYYEAGITWALNNFSN